MIFAPSIQIVEHFNLIRILYKFNPLTMCMKKVVNKVVIYVIKTTTKYFNLALSSLEQFNHRYNNCIIDDIKTFKKCIQHFVYMGEMMEMAHTNCTSSVPQGENRIHFLREMHCYGPYLELVEFVAA